MDTNNYMRFYFSCVSSLAIFTKYKGATKLKMRVPALKNSELHRKWLRKLFKDCLLFGASRACDVRVPLYLAC